MIKYNKLVRDEIPEIIKQSGKKCSTRLLNESEHLEYLYKKLDEETLEFQENYDINELADILEVIECILHFRGIAEDDFKKIKLDKQVTRGSFIKGICLESVE